MALVRIRPHGRYRGCATHISNREPFRAHATPRLDSPARVCVPVRHPLGRQSGEQPAAFAGGACDEAIRQPHSGPRGHPDQLVPAGIRLLDKLSVEGRTCGRKGHGAGRQLRNPSAGLEASGSKASRPANLRCSQRSHPGDSWLARDHPYGNFGSANRALWVGLATRVLERSLRCLRLVCLGQGTAAARRLRLDLAIAGPHIRRHQAISDEPRQGGSRISHTHRDGGLAAALPAIRWSAAAIAAAAQFSRKAVAGSVAPALAGRDSRAAADQDRVPRGKAAARRRRIATWVCAGMARVGSGER
jgi:hypothetical protein